MICIILTNEVIDVLLVKLHSLLFTEVRIYCLFGLFAMAISFLKPVVFIDFTTLIIKHVLINWLRGLRLFHIR